jgi:tetratricopeptide (TPR) repeat protein
VSEPPQESTSERGEHHNVLSGTVHGSVVQARDIANLHVHFARPPMPVPRQLPPAPTQFVNREVELGRLDRLMKRSRTAGLAPVAVLTGGHGVGKSATGNYWAHTNSERFADGQLYADLGEIRHRGGVSTNDLLGGFLRALGLDDMVIPVDLSERTALFRSRLAGKRMLVLLDDVEHAAQVKPLIPASADCVVLVTSRSPLEELVFDGADVVHVAPLDESSAHALLVAMIGMERVTADPAAVTALARICGGLPVALRVCGAQLAGPRRDKPVSWLAARLADETRRLSRLSRGPGHSLQAVFDDAYRGLGTEAANLYRALGLHPGPNATTAVGAAALLWPVEKVSDALDELLAARLIEADGERFRFHDLLRTHARRTVEREEPGVEQEAILQNIVTFYIAAAQRMDLAVMPDRLRMAAPPPAATEDQPVFSSTAEALKWFDEERANLVAVVRVCHEREWDAQAWQLGEAMWIAYNNHKNFDEAHEVYKLAVEAATRAGDRDVEARMRQQLARGEIDLQNYAAAELELGRAETLADRSSNRLLRASIIEFVGILQFDRGEHDAALEAFERARAACEAIGYARGVVIQEYFLGRVLATMGRPRDAIEHLQRAEALVDRAGDPLTYGRVLIRLGEALSAAGETSAATASLTAAAQIMRRSEVPYYTALALEGLADVRRRERDVVEEAQHLTAALAIYDALGSPRSQAISLRLEQLAG